MRNIRFVLHAGGPPARVMLAAALQLCLTLIFLSISAVPAPVSAGVLLDGRNKPCVLPSGAVALEMNKPGQGWAGFTQPIPYAPGVLITYDTNTLSRMFQSAAVIVQQALNAGNPNVSPSDVTRAPAIILETVVYHECTHARTGAGPNAEIAVNCTAFLSMSNLGELTAHDIYVQGLIMHSPALNSIPIGPNYGGSMANFFDDTMTCFNTGVAPLALDTVAPH